MTEVEEFIASQKRFRCANLSADLTQKQCLQNRQRDNIFACIDCPGLGAEVVVDNSAKCECGRPVFAKSTGQCRPCYDKAAHAKRKALKAAAVPVVTDADIKQAIAEGREFGAAIAKEGRAMCGIKNPLIQPLRSDKQIVLDLLHKHDLWEWLQECEISAENIIELLEAARMPGLRLVV